MATLNLHNRIGLDIVTISGIFIDEYMPQASGEFVKLYLCLLRAFQKPEMPLSISLMAVRFNLTEKDVMQALSYWEKQGLLHLSFDSNHNLTDISLLDILPKNKSLSQEKDTLSQPPIVSQKPTAVSDSLAISKEALENLSQDDSFKELLFVAQTYLRRTFKGTDCDMFGYWYLMFNRSYEIIEYLLEYCVEQGHTNLKYLEAVARNWHEKGLRSVSDIKEYGNAHTKTVYAVMKAFGLQDRAPAPKEANYIKKWSNTYHFSLDLILKACEKTISATHNPSFEYTDSILSAWNKANITTLEQVSHLDQQYQNTQKKRGTDTRRAAKSTTQFHNFKQRDTDYDQLVANYYGYNN